MRKILTTCLCSIFAGLTLFAQDIIITTDAQKIEAKILEVSKTEIKYKEKSNLDGPTFILETKEISSIIYSNGQVKVYNQPVQNEVPEKQEITSVAEEAPANVAPTIDESTAQILLLSGQTLTVQITDLKSNYVAYILDGKPYTMPASQIDKVTFLQNGQVKEYTSQSAAETTTIAPIKDETSTTNTSPVQSGRIYRDNGHYIYNNIYISSKEVERIIKRENAEAYRHWQKADGMIVGGSICVGIGGGLIIGGLFFIKSNPIATIGIECSAIVPLGIGLGLTLGASSQYNKAIDIYNSKYDHAAVQLRWQVSGNGIGLALAF